MEVILKETIETLGREGDIVKVKDGYGRNFLFPRKKAVPANKSNLAVLAQENASIKARRQKEQEEADSLAKKISRLNIVIEQRVGDENKLFGSVTSADIVAKLNELGVTVDKRKVLLDEPIKALGETKVSIKVGFQKTAEIKVNIVPLTTE